MHSITLSRSVQFMALTVHHLAGDGSCASPAHRLRFLFEPLRDTSHDLVFGVADGSLKEEWPSAGMQFTELFREYHRPRVRCHVSNSTAIAPPSVAHSQSSGSSA